MEVVYLEWFLVNSNKINNWNSAENGWFQLIVSWVVAILCCHPLLKIGGFKMKTCDYLNLISGSSRRYFDSWSILHHFTPKNGFKHEPIRNRWWYSMTKSTLIAVLAIFQVLEVFELTFYQSNPHIWPIFLLNYDLKWPLWVKQMDSNESRERSRGMVKSTSRYITVAYLNMGVQRKIVIFGKVAQLWLGLNKRGSLECEIWILEEKMKIHNSIFTLWKQKFIK